VPTNRKQGIAEGDGSINAALKFAMSIRERTSVSRLGFSGENADATFWVFIDNEDFGEIEGIFRLAQDTQLAHPSAVPFRLHVIPRDQVNNQALPPLTVLFSRT
jgi:hypothetical protein